MLINANLHIGMLELQVVYKKTRLEWDCHLQKTYTYYIVLSEFAQKFRYQHMTFQNTQWHEVWLNSNFIDCSLLV